MDSGYLDIKPDENFEEYAIRLYLSYMNDNEYSLTHFDIATLLNSVNGDDLSITSYRKKYMPMAEGYEKGYADGVTITNSNVNKQKQEYTETISTHSDGSKTSDRLIFIKESDKESPDVLLKLHNFDPNYWDLTHATNNYWSSMPSKDSQEEHREMYQSKITVKPKKHLAFKMMEECFLDLDRNFIKPKRSKVEVKNNNVLLVPIADLHYGRMSAENVSGHDYNMKIAEDIFFYIINDILEYGKDNKVDKIWFPIGNDIINTDNKFNETTRGTGQDTDGIWQEVVLDCQKMLIKGIEMLKDLADVEIFYIKSNHDEHTTFQLYQFLAAWFRNDKHVSVDMNFTYYNFKRYGNGVYGFAHNIKKNTAHKLFDNFAREYLSSTQFREMFLAHTHTHQVEYDDGGTVIRRLPSMALPCDWSHQNQFIGNVQKSKSFLINDKYGITDIHNTIML